MSATVVTSNDKVASIGTLGFHAVLIALLFLVKCPGTSTGGGGNDGLGNSGYMSMDVAGLGNSVDGWGPTEDAAKPEVTTDSSPVVEETTSVTDDSPTSEAPVVNNKPNTKPSTTKPNTTTPKPTPTPTPQQPSKGLSNALGNLGGNGNTSGNGNQGTESGSVDGKGVMGGGGSQGTGGGQGGGNGTGTGSGNGDGVSFLLAGRKLNANSIKKEVAPDEGKVVVDIWVDKDGNVTKAVVNPAKSNTTNSKLYAMAEKAARNAKFSVSETGANEQKGSITINFTLN